MPTLLTCLLSLPIPRLPWFLVTANPAHCARSHQRDVMVNSPSTTSPLPTLLVHPSPFSLTSRSSYPQTKLLSSSAPPDPASPPSLSSFSACTNLKRGRSAWTSRTSDSSTRNGCAHT